MKRASPLAGSSRRSWPIIGLFVIAALFQNLPRTFAAPPERRSSTESGVDPGSSLILPQDRQIEQWLGSARRSIDSGEFGNAVIMLLRIVNADEESFVAGPGQTTLSPAREQAVRLASSLPDDVRVRFENEIDRLAREARLAMARDDRTDAIAEFAYRYRASVSGLDSLRLLAATYRDNGHHQQAAVAWRAAVEHSRITKAQRAIAEAAYIESLLADGHLDTAESTVGDSKWLGNDETVTIAGKSVVAREWISLRVQEARRNRPTAGQPAAKNPKGVLPALQPVWSKETSTLVELQKNVTQIQRYFRDQGAVSSHAIRPVVSGNIVLTRTMQELQAFDLNSGEYLWSIPNHEYAWVSKRPASLDEGHFRSATAATWHRQMEADSVFGAISTNGKLVVVVQEPDRTNFEFPASNGRGPNIPPNRPVAVTRWNKLCGYEISSRQLRWQVGGPPTGPADLLGGTSFQGTPLFVDNLMFVVARKDDELSLLAMDHQTGHLRWSVKLGILAPHLADSMARRRVACPVTLVGGQLLCPTASGALVAVDLTTRSLSWVHRYPVIQHEMRIRTVNGGTTPTPPDVWWNEWREVKCLTTDVPGRLAKLVLLASPDSDQLQVLNAADGTMQWSTPRSGALHLAAIVRDVAILIEPMAVRAHDLQTGQLRWRAETGEISGLGAIVGEQLIQPRRAGGFAVINLADGSLSCSLARADAVYGSLIPCDGGWITQTDQSLHRLPLLEAERGRVLSQWETERSATSALELARLDLQADDPVAVRRRLDGNDSPEARVLRREAILAILRTQSKAINEQSKLLTQERIELGSGLLDLCESNEDRLVALRSLGDAAWATGDSVGAMTFFLNGMDLIDSIGLRSLGSWSADDMTSRTVRPDRVLLGAVQRILEDAMSRDTAANSMLQRELEQVLEARLEVARASEDPFAVQRLIDRLLPIEWGRRALLANSKAAAYARSLQKVESLFMQAAGSRSRETSANALFQLAEFQARSGWRSEAEAVQRRLLNEYAGTRLSNGQTFAVQLASKTEHTDLRLRLLAPVPDLWPIRMPNVEKEVKRNGDMYRVPVRVQASPGSLLDRLDVSVDRSGRDVWFTADGVSGTWKRQLPGVPKPFRTAFAALDQIEAFGVGRLLVLRVGFEVFGINPFNERGEPRAEVTSLQLNIAPTGDGMVNDVPDPEPIPARVGIRHEGVRLVDSFGRRMGGLGPVRSGYLCFRSQAKLVAVDTQSGQRLWERLDLPPNCLVFGDDDYVYLWRTDERSLQTLSAVDGRSIGERPWNVAVDDILLHDGSHVWTVARESSIVRLQDLRDGSTVWSRQFAGKSIPFALDPSTVAVLEPLGSLHLIAANTGASLGETMTVEIPEKVERIVCLQDAQRWYIAISGPVPGLPVLQADQLWNGLRMCFVNGWMYGVERQSGAIVWRRFLDSEPLPQTVSHSVPLLIQMWKRSGGDGDSGSGTLRLLDTRTGRDVLTHRHPTLQPHFFLLPSENREKLELSTEHEVFRLNYNTTSQETQQQRARDK